MIIHILAGGPEENVPSLHRWKDAVWIGVDRGVFSLLNKGIVPQKAVGDFDSITSEELQYVREKMQDIELYPSEKDETDLEIALNWAVDQRPTIIRVFGATGGRLDHMFGGIQLLYKGLEKGIRIQMIDQKNIIELCKSGEFESIKDESYPYVSFVPFSPIIENLTLKGFKYPLTNYNLEWGSTLCISNELLEQRGTFSFTKGILMMIRSSD
ncbi:thiamine diphosphokinase [Metabacillus iocasae]|uniref:Thiamine diphosphokinase n=1 Tax=Priestia iocasae TaxID=2291674 RepID=A0ABS2QST6_9BACI|nr:thiamine diphosphokinase [Metabacillus iocasae]MBM7701821.1 thiamine pyrophosphokinase [Metabacillus iocasae]